MEKPLNRKEDPDEGGDVEDSNKEEDKPDGTITAASNAKDDCSDLTDNIDDTEDQTPKSFPQRLMDILSNESNHEVISWLPHGTGFQIHKKKTFANDILPHYFKQSKFTSFTRKLNRWGFSRVPRGPETGAYFHKLFRRDKPELCLQMTSNSGNKYQANPMHQQLLPNVPGMAMPAGGMPGMAMPAMFPYIPNPMMMTGMTPQQQHVMWQQQMQQMMLFQQQQMMQMQQQSQMGNMMGGPMMGNMMGGPMGLMMAGGLPTSPMNASAGGDVNNNSNAKNNGKDESDAAAETTEEEANKPAEEEV